jgi:hypothetical protein
MVLNINGNRGQDMYQTHKVRMIRNELWSVTRICTMSMESKAQLVSYYDDLEDRAYWVNAGLGTIAEAIGYIRDRH